MSSASSEQQRSNKILISRNRNLYFYVNLAKKYLQDMETVELSGLGQAINIVVSCAEILKNQQFVQIVNIETSTAQLASDDNEDVMFSKAKIQVTLKKSDKFDELIAQEQKQLAEKRQAREQQQQQQQQQQQPQQS